MSKLYENLKTLNECFFHWEKTTPDSIFLRQPQGENWKTLTYAEAGQEARKMTSALRAAGLKKGDHIGISSKNCYHWILADLAIMMGGYISVPFYPSLPKDQLNEVIIKADLKAIFCGKYDAWGDRAEGIPDNVIVIRFPHYTGNSKVEIGEKWNELIASNIPFKENYIPDLDDLWTILFTSGTTGTPKGVMHTYKAPAMIFRNEELTNFLGKNQLKSYKYFSFLPLNHVAERLGVSSPAIYYGGSISFAESLATFAKNLQDTQPSSIFAVPRIWTKFYLGVLAKMSQKKMDMLFKIPIISGIVKRKLRTALGLRDAQITATGAAITPQYLKDWYAKLGLHLIEAYGMTEVCGSITNGPGRNTPSDSVGEVVPNCKIKVDPVTQEILMASPWMMKGYYKDPDLTAKVIIDGWMHSGDRGWIDENGFLRVVGRVKDSFKTSKGQFIIPNPIEEKLSQSDFIEQVCVAGLTTPQPVALVNLSEIAMATEKEQIEKILNEELKRTNANLSGYQKISTIIINKEIWSESNEMLTPTLKIRRGKIDERYNDKYLAWHEANEKVVWEA
ncbi:MAG: AMP-binding protein [Saprospiraceae bacterium]|nr:AMP-binding protein [Saprospiraceae bacterium]